MNTEQTSKNIFMYGLQTLHILEESCRFERGFEKRFLEEGGLTRVRKHCLSGVKICHGRLHGQRLLKK